MELKNKFNILAEGTKLFPTRNAVIEYSKTTHIVDKKLLDIPKKVSKETIKSDSKGKSPKKITKKSMKTADAQ